jgi:hypothetical protein
MERQSRGEMTHPSPPSPPVTWTREPGPEGSFTLRRGERLQPSVITCLFYAALLVAAGFGLMEPDEQLGTLVSVTSAVPFVGLAGYLALARKRLSFSGERLVAVDREAPVTRRSEHVLDLDDVTFVEACERQTRWPLIRRYTWELRVHLGAGSMLPVLTGLESEEEATWLVQVLQQALDERGRA